MKRFILLFIGLECLIPLSAQEHLRTADAETLAVGRNGVIQSTVYNPAILANSEVKYFHFGLFNKYGLKELSTFQCGLDFPNRFLSIAIEMFSFGYSDYRENMVRLALGKRLSRHWIAGISVQEKKIQNKLYDEQQNSLTADVGILYTVENLLFGLAVIDLPTADYDCSAGFRWYATKEFSVLGSVERQRNKSFNGSLGLTYQVYECLSFRAGIVCKPLLPSFGFGLKFHHFRIDAAAVFHSVLGVSSGIEVKYQF